VALESLRRGLHIHLALLQRLFVVIAAVAKSPWKEDGTKAFNSETEIAMIIKSYGDFLRGSHEMANKPQTGSRVEVRKEVSRKKKNE
jgi:hypothetical protein